MALFRREKTKRRHAKRRQDEITPSEKTKRRHAKKRKDEKTLCEKTTKLKFQMASFRAKISFFRVAGFVLSSFCIGVISSFRLFAWLFFVFLFFRMAFFHLFAWRLFAAKRRKDEMAQTGHHTMVHPLHVRLPGCFVKDLCNKEAK